MFQSGAGFRPSTVCMMFCRFGQGYLRHPIAWNLSESLFLEDNFNNVSGWEGNTKGCQKCTPHSAISKNTPYSTYPLVSGYVFVWKAIFFQIPNKRIFGVAGTFGFQVAQAPIPIISSYTDLPKANRSCDLFFFPPPPPPRVGVFLLNQGFNSPKNSTPIQSDGL